MRKFIIFAILILVTKCQAIEVTSIDIRETFFKNNVKSYKDRIYGNFQIKGVWGDSKKISKRVMQEELYCNINTMSCTSASTSLDFLGTPQLQPYLDTYLNNYEIIDIKGSKIKLYSSETEYTIEVDLTKKNAVKAKVFNNGDVNRYILLQDYNYIEQYIKQLIIK